MMIDFTHCKEQFNIYKGSEKKKTLIYNYKKYLVKFPDPIRQKNKNVSYINNAFSEYIGSHVFQLCGIKTQNTILGTYHYNGENKIVCACEDFTDSETVLYEFENLVLSTYPDKKIDTEINDIIKVIETNKNRIDVEKTKMYFWDMFVIDYLIGNTDRHNGNWGFLLHKETEKTILSPIYDCGSCLTPILEDKEIKALDETELKNMVFNTHSCLKEEGKKINYLNYMSERKNNDCDQAVRRIFQYIPIDEIMQFIDDIEELSDIRKQFYKKVLEMRYKQLEKIFQKIENLYG